jgi:hypothetical protein
VTISGYVTNIMSFAFDGCTNVTGFYFPGVPFFQANAPSIYNSSVFSNDINAIIYYLPGATGWLSPFGGLQTRLWLPQIKTGDASFGIQTNQFRFGISWADGKTIHVEASTDPANPVWSPVATITLTNGSFYFSDSQWTNYPSRFYRVRSP